MRDVPPQNEALSGTAAYPNINELDVQETTDQVDRMSDSFYYFGIQISDKDIPVELDEDTISINNERYQADTSDLRELLDKTYRDVMSGVID